MIDASRSSDAQLIRAAANDPDAFRFLYDRYAERLHAFFARRTGNADVALDLTAETFARTWVSKRRFPRSGRRQRRPMDLRDRAALLINSVAQRRLETTMLDR